MSRRIGPKQMAWVSAHAFPNGAWVVHLGPFMLARRISDSNPQFDPDEWNEGLAPAPTIDPRWASR